MCKSSVPMANFGYHGGSGGSGGLQRIRSKSTLTGKERSSGRKEKWETLTGWDTTDEYDDTGIGAWSKRRSREERKSGEDLSTPTQASSRQLAPYTCRVVSKCHELEDVQIYIDDSLAPRLKAKPNCKRLSKDNNTGGKDSERKQSSKSSRESSAGKATGAGADLGKLVEEEAEEKEGGGKKSETDVRKRAKRLINLSQAQPRGRNGKGKDTVDDEGEEEDMEGGVKEGAADEGKETTGSEESSTNNSIATKENGATLSNGSKAKSPEPPPPPQEPKKPIRLSYTRSNITLKNMYSSTTSSSVLNPTLDSMNSMTSNLDVTEPRTLGSSSGNPMLKNQVRLFTPPEKVVRPTTPVKSSASQTSPVKAFNGQRMDSSRLKQESYSANLTTKSGSLRNNSVDNGDGRTDIGRQNKTEFTSINGFNGLTVATLKSGPNLNSNSANNISQTNGSSSSNGVSVSATDPSDSNSRPTTRERRPSAQRQVMLVLKKVSLQDNLQDADDIDSTQIKWLPFSANSRPNSQQSSQQLLRHGSISLSLKNAPYQNGTKSGVPLLWANPDEFGHSPKMENPDSAALDPDSTNGSKFSTTYFQIGDLLPAVEHSMSKTKFSGRILNGGGERNGSDRGGGEMSVHGGQDVMVPYEENLIMMKEGVEMLRLKEKNNNTNNPGPPAFRPPSHTTPLHRAKETSTKRLLYGNLSNGKAGGGSSYMEGNRGTPEDELSMPPTRWQSSSCTKLSSSSPSSARLSAPSRLHAANHYTTEAPATSKISRRRGESVGEKRGTEGDSSTSGSPRRPPPAPNKAELASRPSVKQGKVVSILRQKSTL